VVDDFQHLFPPVARHVARSDAFAYAIAFKTDRKRMGSLDANARYVLKSRLKIPLIVAPMFLVFGVTSLQ
jgi:hypothetical protein